MCSNLVTSSWVSIGEGCELKFYLNDDSVDFVISGASQLFEFECRAGALREFVELARRALAEMEARHALELT